MAAPLFAALLGALGMACSQAVEAPASESADAVKGDATSDKSKTVGQLVIGSDDDSTTYCTAALIRKDVVLSAAQCVARAANADTVQGSFFLGTHLDLSKELDDNVVDHAFIGLPKDGTAYASDLDKALVLLRLSAPVAGAVPVKFARALPAKGDKLSVYGYGCNESRDDFGVLRRATIAWGAMFGSSTGCPGMRGDYGAPILDESGSLVAVLGAVDAGLWALATGTDDIVTLTDDTRSAIAKQLAGW